jgi:hypothetical protein
MHLRTSLLISLLRIASICAALNYSPYRNPYFGLDEGALLVKRQGCAAGLASCSNFGSDSVCCPSDTTCTVDGANQLACCPTSASCSGTLGTTVPTNGVTTTTNSNGATVTGIGSGGTTIANPYYPFVALPTTFPDAAACSTAFTSCQSASTACFTSLAGVNGVTIGGLGGGITVQGSSGTLLSSVSSICSSLSSEGCSAVQSVSQCSQFGGGSGVTPTTIQSITGITGVTGTSTGGIVFNNFGVRQTACPGVVYMGGVGAVIGAVRGVL